MVSRYMESGKVQQERTTSRQAITRSQGPGSKPRTCRAMRKSSRLLPCFLSRSRLGGVGYESLEIQAKTALRETPTDHSTIGLRNGLRDIPEEWSALEEHVDREDWGPGKDGHEGESHVKGRGGWKQNGVRSQSREWKRKPEMKKKWSGALRNDSLIISEALIQRVLQRNHNNLGLGQLCSFLEKQYKYMY